MPRCGLTGMRFLAGPPTPRSPVMRCWRGVRCPMPRMQASSTGGENSDAATSMTEKEALKVLGMSRLVSFDDVVNAKNQLLSSDEADGPKAEEIEAAYDCLLMLSMKKRLAGESDVPRSVRFADVRRKNSGTQAKAFLQKLPGGGLSIETPPSNVFLTNSLVFIPLAAWALVQGLTMPEGFPGDVVPGFPLAVAAAWSVYSLREYKRMGLGKSAAYTAVGLIVGALAGGLIEGFARVDENPLGPLHSPATFVSEFALISLWASATFLT